MPSNDIQSYNKSDGTINLWHGSRRWVGPPEIRVGSKGRCENGPGIYLTTRYETARKYSKGGGIVLKAELKSSLAWLENARMDVEYLKQFVNDLPRLHKRKALLNDLDWSAQRHSDDKLPVSYLVNLFVNHDLASGESGKALALWLADQGIDASLYHRSGQEDYVVVFNPKCIVNIRRLKDDEAHLQWMDFPLVKEQLESLSESRAIHPLSEDDGESLRMT